jgi:hypothetical protein
VPTQLPREEPHSWAGLAAKTGEGVSRYFCASPNLAHG